jgi:hypothetical protein
MINLSFKFGVQLFQSASFQPVGQVERLKDTTALLGIAQFKEVIVVSREVTFSYRNFIFSWVLFQLLEVSMSQAFTSVGHSQVGLLRLA